MIEDYIRYDQLVDGAMREVVRKALEQVKQEGFSGNHHFLISFLTECQGVEISQKLKEKYPEEMTIVLQHQYEDLEISEDGFQVVLSFDGSKEKIKIPFVALSAFADPGVKFGLKFNILLDEPFMDELVEDNIQEKKETTPTKIKKSKKTNKKGKSAKITLDNNVVALDGFRKKDDKKK